MSTFLKNKYLLILLLLPLVLVGIWFRHGLIIGGGDEALLFYNTQKTFDISTTTWLGYGTGSPTLFWLSRAPFLYFTNFLHEIFLFPDFFLQAATFYLLMVTGIVSVYYLTLQFLIKHNLRQQISFFSALFYLLNPYSMSQIWGRGEYAQYFSFAVIPFMLLLFVIALEKKKYVFAPLIAFASLPFATAYGFTTVVFTQWLLFILYSIYIFISEKDKKRTGIFITLFLFTTFIIWTLFHFWWIFPLMLSGGSLLGSYLNSGQENINTLIGVSGNYRPLVLIRLLQDTYFFAPSAFSTLYITPIFQIISFLFPVLLLIGLLNIFKKKELKNFRIFVGLFFIGLFVSLGANPPFGVIFIWFFKHIPVLQMFRNPYEKFGLVYVLGYAPLFAIGMVYFFKMLFEKRLLNKFQLLILGVILFIVLNIYLWPMWSGKIVGFPDDKIGLPHMEYYDQLNSFLNKQGENNFRVLMTPVWSGDGAYYMWGEKRYQGIDPMMFFINQEIVGSSSQLPLYYDLIRTIRQNIYKEDVSGALSLMRIKYLVNRSDAVFISPIEKQQSTFLTYYYYPPNELSELSTVVCEDKNAVLNGESPAWITCALDSDKRNFTDVKYLHLIVKTDVPANIDLAIKDNKENRPNWYGKIPGEYATAANQWTTIIVPLGVPTDGNNQTDLSKIVSIDLRAHPFYQHNFSVGKIELQGIWLDDGLMRQANNFKKIQDFDKLQVYKMKNTILPPEVGVLNSVDTIQSFDDLVTESYRDINKLNHKGFILLLQNEGKNLASLKGEEKLETVDTKQITKERFWMQVKGSGGGLVLLSKTFNPGWKVIEGVDKKDLSGGLFSDLKLLKKSVVSEENHFVVNGYANLWKVDGHADTIGVVFLPQVYADLGRDISFGTIILVSLTTLGYFVIKRKKHRKK